MKTRDFFVTGCFFLVNLLQAAFTQLTGDEALYWMYSVHPDLGYRDHPPLIGVLTGFGYALINNELGVRLFIALANFTMLVVLYRLVRPTQWWHFVLLFLSIPVISIYGFIATPDAPLLLFTALYLLIWKRFIADAKSGAWVWLGICMAGLMWSKYHGILIILLLLLPLRRLWFNRYFWFAALTGITLYIPHLAWQIIHDLPTIKFHLNERNSDALHLGHILGYSAGQLAVFNPVVLGLVLVLMIRTSPKDAFERSLRWLIAGMLLLFFLNSFRGRVEPHWTAPLTLAAIYLICRHWEIRPPHKWVWGSLAVISCAIIVLRVFLAIDLHPGFYKTFHRDKSKMLALHKLAGDTTVCFMNSYQNPSLYRFYTGQSAHSINNTAGGKNQYDYWDYGSLVHKRPMLFVSGFDHQAFMEREQDGFVFRIHVYEDLPVLNKMMIRTDTWRHEVSEGQELAIPAWLVNGNDYTFDLQDTLHTIRWIAFYNHKKPHAAEADVHIDQLPEWIAAGDSVRVLIRTTVPPLPGSHRMCIAAQVDDLPTTYQSNWLRMIIR